MNQFVEIRSYNLKQGARDEDSYYLSRCYDSPADRARSENAVYGSQEWKQGPREAILALIENYTEVVLELNKVTIRELRK